jgi:hypothetical protein
MLKILHSLLFLRGIKKNFQFVKELLELLHMKEGTGADQIFCQIVTLINKFNLRLEKLVGFIRNGAPAMCGKNKGAAATLKKNKRITGKDFLS